MTITIEDEGRVIEFPDAKAAEEYFASKGGSTVIATTDKGGRIVDIGGGQLSFVSPGFSTNNQKTVKRIMAGTGVKRVVQDDYDQSLLDQYGKTAGFAGNMTKGIPFVGEWVDEAVAHSDPARAERMDMISDAYQRQNPKSAMGARIVGGVAGSLPLAAAAFPSAAARTLSLGQTGLRTAAAGGLLGASEGAVSGAGNQSGNGRADNAKEGAMIGGALGTGLGLVAPYTKEGLKRILAKFKGSNTPTIESALGISKEAAVIIKRALDGDDFEAAAREIEKAGKGAMLLDASPATRSLAQATAKSGGEAQSIITKAVGNRAQDAHRGLVGIMTETMGTPPTGLLGAAEDIAKRTAPQRKAAYDAAFNTPIDYASQQGQNIEALLSRIPAKTLIKAINAANDQMTWRGTSNQQILADISEDGSVAFKQTPNVEQLNALKLQLDEIGRAGVDVFGRSNAQGLLAREMARGVKDATVDAVPAYGKAVKIGGDKIGMDRALELGSKLLRKNTTREDVVRQLAGASTDELNAAKAGVRMHFDEALANIRKTASDPNIEARQLNAAWAELSSPASRQKMELVLGKSGSANLFKKLDEAEAALGARAAVSRNSDTAINQRIQGGIDELLETGPLDMALSGKPVKAIQQALQTVTGTGAEVSQAKKAQLFKEIAQALTQNDTKTAKTALTYVDAAISGEKLTQTQSNIIAHALTAHAALALHQSGTKYLRTPAHAR